MIGYLNRSDERRVCLPFDEGEHLKGGPGFQLVALEIDRYTKHWSIFPYFHLQNHTPKFVIHITDASYGNVTSLRKAPRES